LRRAEEVYTGGDKVVCIGAGDCWVMIILKDLLETCLPEKFKTDDDNNNNGKSGYYLSNG